MCRLVDLAYPLAEPSLTTYVAKEAFITALNSHKLQIKVTKKEPRNTEEAFTVYKAGGVRAISDGE